MPCVHAVCSLVRNVDFTTFKFQIAIEGTSVLVGVNLCHIEDCAMFFITQNKEVFLESPCYIFIQLPATTLAKLQAFSPRTAVLLRVHEDLLCLYFTTWQSSGIFGYPPHV